MEKFKICPHCGTKNPPSNFECEQCGVDLIGVPITEEKPVEVQGSGAAEATPAAQGGYVRHCGCGHDNPVSARKCEQCGEDLTLVFPTPAAPPQKHWKLCDTGRTFSFVLEKESYILGREADLKTYLAGKSYVSRNHCKLYEKDGELYVENLSGTNFTFVNDRKISEATPLNEGDILSLGGIRINGREQTLAAYFTVERE